MSQPALCTDCENDYPPAKCHLEGAMVDWKAMTPQAVWEALKTAPKVAGPWTPHEHTYGCDCGSYPAGSPYRGSWSYREDVNGNEVATCDEVHTKEVADASLRAAGWVLVD